MTVLNQVITSKIKFADSDGRNTLKLFDVLSKFLIPTSKTMRLYSNKHGMYQFPHKLPNDIRFRILESQEISEISQNFVEVQPSAQTFLQIGSVVSTGIKLLRNR